MEIILSKNKEFDDWLRTFLIKATLAIFVLYICSVHLVSIGSAGTAEWTPHIELNISSNPKGADVYIDKVLYDKTPTVYTITDTKTINISLVLTGYDNWTGQYDPNQIQNPDSDKIEVSLNKTEVKPLIPTVTEIATPITTVTEIATPITTVTEIATPITTVTEIATPITTVTEIATPITTVTEVATPIHTEGSDVNGTSFSNNTSNKFEKGPNFLGSTSLIILIIGYLIIKYRK